MSKMQPRQPESRRDSFEKLLRAYPKDKHGDDLENCFDAFDLAMEYASLTELILGAINISVAASKGEEAPDLIWFLVSRCGVVTSMAA